MAEGLDARATILTNLRAAGDLTDGETMFSPAEYLQVRAAPADANNDLLEQFVQALTALRGQVQIVDSEVEARTALLDILRRHEAQSVIGWAAAELPFSGLPEYLAEFDLEYWQLQRDSGRAAKAAVGISGAEALLATTGTVVVRSGPGRGRLPTVLAPVYVVLAREEQLLPNVEAWVAQAGEALGQRGNICFITGPSKTADIEMTLVQGVHGPGEVHVIVLRAGD